jgi:zinc finger-like protein
MLQENNDNVANVIVQEEYEEDHADEERMFAETDALLTQLREALLAHYNNPQSPPNDDGGSSNSYHRRHDAEHNQFLGNMSRDLSSKVGRLSQHLHEHLDKEETQCLPLVVNHLSGPEIHELVGNIMGKRSADTIANIMTMAVQNLDEQDRRDMIRYMKQSMTGTFFDRWLQMSGWMSACDEASDKDGENDDKDEDDDGEGGAGRKRAAEPSAGSEEVEPGNDAARSKRSRDENKQPDAVVSSQATPDWSTTGTGAASAYSTQPLETTSQTELEKLIRAVASNPALTPAQKNTTIQGLRDSVWKLNLRQKQQQLERVTVVNEVIPQFPAFLAQAAERVSPASSTARTRKVRVTPPSNYYRKTRHGKVELVWSSDSPTSRLPDNSAIPLFSATELAPTYHDGAAGAVLGCAHYARACKLRHPRSGRLYTCRLCCQQQRELPTSDADEPLDRYEVTEVMCMKCNTLQPAEDRCVNPDCESGGKPFARYFCRICHLYDDGSRPIFHCPYCNICKVGVGLGQDFRHCMRCNACISLPEYTDHHCIPQKLQGDCPICHESLFQSTEPLRGLRCGHVMHLSCFTNYRRGHSYTCPLCMRSMEDMTDYFSILDAAVRMQPMPPAYLTTLSNIYCQDCGKTGQVAYHFVGQKCPHCGSYNTREMGRVNNSPS